MLAHALFHLGSLQEERCATSYKVDSLPYDTLSRVCEDVKLPSLELAVPIAQADEAFVGAERGGAQGRPRDEKGLVAVASYRSTSVGLGLL